jgi:tRNA(fMet)-specific endonuclease VapC
MRYMLDTNTVSFLLRRHPVVVAKVSSVPVQALCISVITEAEFLYGLAKRPESTRLRRLVDEFLSCATVLPWERREAERYGILRADLERRGVTVATLDLLIASHALEQRAILVSSDRVFTRIGGLNVEDWTV